MEEDRMTSLHIGADVRSHRLEDKKEDKMISLHMDSEATDKKRTRK
jgi:hypothetical protein